MGNWKKVLEDPRFHFNGRSSVDLKDRFVAETLDCLRRGFFFPFPFLTMRRTGFARVFPKNTESLTILSLGRIPSGYPVLHRKVIPLSLPLYHPRPPRSKAKRAGRRLQKLSFTMSRFLKSLVFPIAFLRFNVVREESSLLRKMNAFFMVSILYVLRFRTSSRHVAHSTAPPPKTIYSQN